MKKILYGLMGIVMTGAVVAGSAFALFSAQATVSGINFSTSNVSLLVSGDGSNFDSSLNAGLNITNAFPGFGVNNDQTATLYVRNDNSGVPLDLTAQLTAATGWNSNDLKNHVEVAVVPDGTDPSTVDDEEYLTLAEWNAAPQDLPGDPLANNETRAYDVYVRLPESAPDTLENTSLTNITFTITGTQTVVASPTPSPEPSPES